MEQVLIYLEKKEELNLDMLNIKQKALVDLGNTMLYGDKESIKLRVKDALDVGSTHEEILLLLAWIIKHKPSLELIKNITNSLDFEE